MLPGFTTTGVTGDVLDQTITEAVNSCEEDTEDCFDCINSRCVLDNIAAELGGQSAKDEIKLNYLIMLLDLDSDQKEFLKKNPEYLDNLLGKYGLKSAEIGCDLGQCGSEGAARAHIELLETGITVSDDQRIKLCDHYTGMYNAEPNDWYFCSLENFSFDYNRLLIATDENYLNEDFGSSDLGDFLSNECVINTLVNLGPDDLDDLAVVDKIVNWFLASNPAMKAQTDAFLAKYPNDPDAQEHLNRHVLMMAGDAEYMNFVAESAGGASVGFGGAMWAIIAEVMGDKAVDIGFKLIPGFGNADEIKDAIKAAKNGDWFEFTMEFGKIIGKNTPAGKWWKVLEGTNEMRLLYGKLDKVRKAVDGFAEAVIEQMWDIARKYSPDIKLNTGLLKSLARGIDNGVARIDDVLDAIGNWDKLDDRH